MGIIEKGANGPFRGKAGSVIGSSWRKINYIKGLPRFPKQHTPSAKQATQRQKFILLTHFLRPLSKLLELGFRKYTDRATGYNAAFRFNYDHAFVETGEAITLNYSALQFSEGTLYPAGGERAWTEGHVLYITWDPNTYGMGGAVDDVVYITGYHPLEDFFVSEQECIRGDGGARIDLNGLSPAGMHVWLFFTNRQQTQVSKTVYVPIPETRS